MAEPIPLDLSPFIWQMLKTMVVDFWFVWPILFAVAFLRGVMDRFFETGPRRR